MDTIQLRLAGAGLFCLLIFFSGFWLSRSGKPYSGIKLNIHKLLALAAVVLFVITLVQENRAAALAAVELTASVVTGLFLLGLFVTGGLASISRPMPAIVLKLHHITPYLAVLSAAAALYLLLIRKG